MKKSYAGIAILVLALAALAFFAWPPDARGAGSVKAYNPAEIMVVVAALYLTSYALSRKGVMTDAVHRKVWNTLLLVTLVVLGTLSVLLTFSITYGLSISYRFEMLYAHVQTGMFMVVALAFHVGERFGFYTGMLRQGKE